MRRGGETRHSARHGLVIAACILMWATCAHAPRGRAEDRAGAPSSEPASAPTSSPSGAPESGEAAAPTVMAKLAALRDAIEHARFEEARREATELLERTSLRAGERNTLLELLAIAQIAARDEISARETLRTLFARDPEHREGVRDPGPSVAAAFARARGEATTALLPELSTRLLRTAGGNAIAEVTLARDRDAVESVHLFARSDGRRSHLVQEVEAHATLQLALPPLHSGRLELHVEARAPSGAVLAQSGSADQPLVFTLPTAPAPCPANGGAQPLRRAWWLWTSVAIVVAGLGVSGAIAAQ